jgi:parallel beta-helix repeat protein
LIRNSNALNNSASGFDGSAAGECCVIQDCTATNNLSFGFTGTDDNVSFYNNVANCNGTNFDEFSASSAQSGMLDSKIDSLTNLVNTDFAGTFTVLATISGGSCDLSGTYTSLSALGLCNAIPLTVPITGTTIAAAGVYCLTNDVNIGTNTILISASDVVLDLNQRTISGSTTQLIQISNGSNYCTIQNGTLKGNAGFTVGVSTSGTNTFLTLRDLVFTATNAMSFTTLQNSHFENIYSASTGSGIVISSGNNLTFNNCEMSGANTGFGIAVIGTTGLLFNNCVVNNFSDGFFINEADVSFYNCKANFCVTNFNILNSNATLGRHIYVENCVATEAAGSNFFVIFGASDTTASVVLRDCTANRGTAGFNIVNAPRSLLLNCISEATTTQGFRFAGCTNAVTQNCTASGSSVGFQLAGSNSCTIAGCVAARNTTGFSTNTGTNVFYANTATLNTTSYSGVVSPPSAPQVLFAAGVYGANLADVLP